MATHAVMRPGGRGRAFAAVPVASGKDEMRRMTFEDEIRMLMTA